jgi:gliding motility-associated-like protein
MPKARDNDTTIVVNTSVDIDVIHNDSLPNGITSLTVLGYPVNGSVAMADSTTIRYTPNTDYCGRDEMVYVVCDANGCDTAFVYIHILCQKVRFFEVFSPNGDGYNDAFVVGGIQNYPNNRLYVFNRWGNLVYEKQNYQNDWDGTWDGKMLPDATYFYIFEDGEGKKYSGYLQLMK